jgi:hypothetical protein
LNAHYRLTQDNTADYAVNSLLRRKPHGKEETQDRKKR